MDEELLARQKLFEQQLRAAEDDDKDGDVLEVWHSFITWLEQRRSEVGFANQYTVMLQKSLRYFAEMTQYNGDKRLVQLYLKSAKMCKEPAIIYKHMVSQRIGTQFALLYTTYAEHLVGCGKQAEAVSLVEQGLSNRAQPIKALHKHLDGLRKAPSLQGFVGKLPTAQPAHMEDQLERTEEFYKPPARSRLCYPKRLVYPPDSEEEHSLEQLRAILPQYRWTEPSFKEADSDHMDMTVALTSHITMHIPLRNMAASGSSAKKTTQGIELMVEEEEEEEEEGSDSSLPEVVSSVDSDKENIIDKENPSKVAAVCKPARQPLAALAVLSSGYEEEEGRGGVGEGFTPGTVDGGLNWPVRGAHSVESGLVTKLSFSEADSLSHSLGRMDSTTDGRSGGASQSGFFSISATLDCETRGKLTEEQRALEREFASTPPDLDDESSVVSWQGRSLGNSQSFEAFHDSWAMDQSKSFSNKKHLSLVGPNESLGTSKTADASHSNHSAFKPYHDSFRDKPCGVVKPSRKPLQEIAVSKPLMMAEEAGEQSYSFQPSKSNLSSFNVYEDTREQSSFVPYHDSWASQSRNEVNPVDKQAPPPPPPPPTTDKGGAPTGERVYYVPVGVPLTAHHDDQLNVAEQTQIDILHPSTTTGPASTPMRGNITLMPLDISMVPQADTLHHQQQAAKLHPVTKPLSPPPPTAPHPHHPPQQQQQQQQQQPVGGTTAGYTRSYLCYPSGLTVIAEESRSFKSSGNSTGSSGSSHMTSSIAPAPLYSGPVEVNPFLPQNINLMLNMLIDATPSVVEVKGQLPHLTCGRGLLLGNTDKLEVIDKIAEGSFAKVYTAHYCGEMKAVKVQRPPLQWEVTILHELHKRLGPGAMSQSFLQFDKAFLYNDASVLVTPFYPCGSLLDLANIGRQNRQHKLDECILLYMSREVFSTVAALHQCGILHTDIKPDNLMIRDIRGVSSLSEAKGKGLCLVDFGRAVDIKAFHEDTTFIGSCETEGFQCVQMLEDRPWKWQADYFGIAATCHVLMFGEYMKLIKDPKTGLYNHPSRIHRQLDVGFWNKLFVSLINTEEPLTLMDQVDLFDRQLRLINTTLFMRQVKLYFSQLLSK